LKILLEDHASDPQYQMRFSREARAASSLNHPNILTVYDIGNEHETPFIVTELIEGESLRQIIRKGPLPIKKLLDFAVQIADGLSSAHQAGLVHRDLKPENIMVTPEGRVKILDFGLAKIEFSNTGGSHEETVPGVTQGVIIGTVPYMSPEQAGGEAVDFRSDQFSFGVILYEMATGIKVFHRSTPIRTIAAIMKEDPPPLNSLNHNAPSLLCDVINRCLQKEPVQRYGATIDLHYQLRDIRENFSQKPASQGSTRRRLSIAIFLFVFIIAVGALIFEKFNRLHTAKPEFQKIDSLALLPLVNLSKDPKQEYFADGMTDELNARLARIESLRVISRSSVMAYKGKQKSLREIAKELNVDAIVEGSVLQVGNKVRINAELIDANSDHHLWAQSYERDLEDVLALQNEVALSIVEEIKIRLNPNEAKSLKQSPTVNPEAYEAYLRARLLHLNNPDLDDKDLALIIELLNRAVELDPKFALAFIHLGRAHSLWVGMDWKNQDEHKKKAKAAIDRAFELQPGIPEGHVALGYYNYHVLKDRDAALKEFNIAGRELPNDPERLWGIALVQRQRGQFQAALDTMQEILQISPVDILLLIQLGVINEQIRRRSEADQYYTRAISLQPDALTPYLCKARNLLQSGDRGKARSVLESIPKKHDGETEWCLYWYKQDIIERNYQEALMRISLMPEVSKKNVLAGLAYRYIKEPKKAHQSFETARVLLEKELQENFNDSYIHSYLALAYAGLGLKVKAIREGKLAIQLLSTSAEAIEGPGQIKNLAHVYVLLGEYDAALTELESLISVPCGYWLSVSSLKSDPIWDPLRTYPRYKQLLKLSFN
jgi:TolB-like protein/Flp pilus assembly protein TadD